MHRRLRWGNVARTAGAVALVAVVVAWPRLAPREPALPGNQAAPIVDGGPQPAPPDAGVRRGAAPRRPARGWAHGQSGLPAGPNRARRRADRKARQRAVEKRRARRRREARKRDEKVGGRDEDEAARERDEKVGGHGEDAAARERNKTVGGREGARAERDEVLVVPADDEDVGAAPEPDEDAAQPTPTNPGDTRRAPTNRNARVDPAAVEFGFEGG
jgi:hypothetical protein